MTEALLQQTLIQTIKGCYPKILISLSLSGTRLTGTPTQKAIIISEWIKQGFRKGLPDLTFYLPEGITIQIELKVGKNKQSEQQIEVETILHSLGHNYFVVYDIPTVVQLIADHTSTDYRKSMYELYGNKLPFPKEEILTYYNLKN